MRVASLGVARPAYYDRNAVGGAQRYNAIVAPHAQTTRWTYTVAAGKKAYVELVAARIVAQTIATVAGISDLGMEINSSGVASTILYVRQATSTTTLPAIYNSLTAQVTLYAADYITAFTSDTSTGGTVAYIADGRYTTFDA